MNKHGNHGPERDELMVRMKARCDADGLPYPPELVQYLGQLDRRRADDE